MAETLYLEIQGRAGPQGHTIQSGTQLWKLTNLIGTDVFKNI